MDKVVRGGKVAVLVSPGYGAGWSTWNDDECLFDPDIVALVERGASTEEIQKAAEAKWPSGYWGGADGLMIEWVEQGAAFEIREYDGSEHIEYASKKWNTA